MERAIAGWVYWYNQERLHSSLGHIPPIEYYNQLPTRKLRRPSRRVTRHSQKFRLIHSFNAFVPALNFHIF
ncbi:hypothetical protein D9R19_04565 [Corynebacterium diphtheriae]|uniref:integrase core domain-containing protein n=1 Tax=Corynebacterium diphtheriae TaxID=1717 RepID=UPI0009675AC6|nr:hypothetical protein BUE62_03220 [Corynebacterium diphtheriae]QBY11077.1 hypothetical protein E4651_03780 [Corynebacterium diphtheriae]RKW92088.1 hypothetical protein D9B36_04585 [Corynebacterium diphtheriae]RLP09291.1 hypothetical protein D9R17_05195 [Corynebacterium diphtheriae]RLP18489.1 hypothetical protein D9R19_04565 [Corynebacterium diphtheriae]